MKTSITKKLSVRIISVLTATTVLLTSNLAVFASTTEGVRVKIPATKSQALKKIVENALTKDFTSEQVINDLKNDLGVKRLLKRAPVMAPQTTEVQPASQPQKAPPALTVNQIYKNILLSLNQLNYTNIMVGSNEANIDKAAKLVTKTHSEFLPQKPVQWSYDNKGTGLLKFTSITEADRNKVYSQYVFAAYILKLALDAKIIYASSKEVVKVKFIHDFMVLYAQYDNRLFTGGMPNDSYEAFGLMNNKLAVCQGYSEAFNVFCWVASIKSMSVVGTGSGKPGLKDHAWNKVTVDGYWYNIDVTWDDPLDKTNPTKQFLDKNGKPLLTYFCITSAALKKDHSWDDTYYSATYLNWSKF